MLVIIRYLSLVFQGFLSKKSIETQLETNGVTSPRASTHLTRARKEVWLNIQGPGTNHQGGAWLPNAYVTWDLGALRWHSGMRIAIRSIAKDIQRHQKTRNSWFISFYFYKWLTMDETKQPFQRHPKTCIQQNNHYSCILSPIFAYYPHQKNIWKNLSKTLQFSKSQPSNMGVKSRWFLGEITVTSFFLVSISASTRKEAQPVPTMTT